MSNDHEIREVAIIFHDAEALETAVEELESAGFDRAAISLLAGEDAVVEKLGHIYERVEELEDDPEAPRTAFVSSASIGDAEGALVGGLLYVGAVATAGAIVASGGTLAAAIAGALLSGGAGAAIGGVLAGWVGAAHAQYLQDQIDKGGLLLWVRTPTPEHVDKAVAILKRLSPSERHIHFHKSIVT
ncbi:MAG: hypothetical protein RLZ98_2479 [Pseudomonadota bacterium]|jgi:hypothetical protein